MKITYQEFIEEDGETVSVPVIPSDATADEIEAIVLEEGAAVMTDEQQALLDKHMNEGVTPEGVAR